MRRGYLLKNPIAFVGLVVSICCILIITISVLKLPEISERNRRMTSYRTIKSRNVSEDAAIGKFGEMMIEMLPEDLAFTVFVPSEKAFERDLRIRVNDSLSAENRNDTYAVISRIMGFSGIPRTLLSSMVDSDKEVSYDSVSGFPLYISKDEDGMVIVNRIRSEIVDVKIKEVIVHIMDGVIMDAEFEQSVQPDDIED